MAHVPYSLRDLLGTCFKSCLCMHFLVCIHISGESVSLNVFGLGIRGQVLGLGLGLGLEGQVLGLGLACCGLDYKSDTNRKHERKVNFLPPPRPLVAQK